MISELYDARGDAGASEASARKSAETMAAYESRFTKIDADLTLLKWMVGFNISATMALLFMAVKR